MTMPSSELATARAAVWPPPVPGYSERIRPPFRSQRRRERQILAFAVLRGALLFAAIVFALLAGSASYRPAQAVAAADALISLLVVLGLAVVFLYWVRETYANLDSFGASGTSTSPGWAEAYYLLPIVNLYRPYKTMVEVWRASTPDADSADQSSWSKLKAPSTILAWWLMYSLFDYTSLSAALQGVSNPRMNASYRAGILTAPALIGIAALILMYKVVLLIDDRQEAKNKAMRAQDETLAA